MCEVIDNIKAEAWAEGWAEGIAEVKAKRRAEEVALGELKRANMLSRLYELLKADGRDNELPSALSNEEFYQKLLHDYQLA